MNLKLTLQYDGTAYHGWQRQQNAITVQEVLENTVSKIFSGKIAITGCSRTDSGVHAKMYVCNFFAETSIPVNKIPFVLNVSLPEDIRVIKCEEVLDSFNARFDTIEKTYEYKIINAPHNNPLLSRYAWHYPNKLDIEKMKEAANIIKGKHDFKSFMASGSKVKSTVRNLKCLDVEKNGDIITIRATADGFLYNMVRILVGTLVYVGNGKIGVDEVFDVLKGLDRTQAGKTVPGKGLCITEVKYSE